jgi:hypothetical protein
MQKIAHRSLVIIAIFSALFVALFLEGCATREKNSVPSALTELKDLHAGVEHGDVHARFGDPISAGTNKDGAPVEVFEFVESAPSKNATLVSEEIREANDNSKPDVTVSMAQTGPITDELTGDLLTVQVSYDEQGMIDDTRLLKAIPGPADR